jgi:hypothetical protein
MDLEDLDFVHLGEVAQSTDASGREVLTNARAEASLVYRDQQGWSACNQVALGFVEFTCCGVGPRRRTSLPVLGQSAFAGQPCPACPLPSDVVARAAALKLNSWSIWRCVSVRQSIREVVCGQTSTRSQYSRATLVAMPTLGAGVRCPRASRRAGASNK